MRRGTEYGSRESPSSGSDDAGEGRQLHVLKPEKLIFFDSGLFAGVTGSASFRVEVPDSRLRVHIAIIAQPPTNSSATPQACLAGKNLTMWLRAVEDGIQSGRGIPITNLWGTNAAPGAIPGYVNAAGAIVADPDLAGWGKEFVTAARAIVGTINYPVAAGAPTCQIMLQVRYTPEAIRFTAVEWQEICAQAGAATIGPVANLG